MGSGTYKYEGGKGNFPVGTSCRADQSSADEDGGQLFITWELQVCVPCGDVRLFSWRSKSCLVMGVVITVE